MTETAQRTAEKRTMIRRPKAPYSNQVIECLFVILARALVQEICVPTGKTMSTNSCDKKDGIPVYEVVPESGQGKSRVLHRNLCTYLPEEKPKTTVKTDKKRTTIQKHSDRRNGTEKCINQQRRGR